MCKPFDATGMYSQAPPQPDELCTTRHQLLPSHESILVGSRGLWEALDKDDAALHTHFHLKVALSARQSPVRKAHRVEVCRS